MDKMKTEDRMKTKLLIVFALIFVSEDVLIFSTNSDRKLFWVKLCFLCILEVVLLIQSLRNHFGFSRKSIILGMVFLANVFLTMYICGDFDNREVYTLLLVLLALNIVSHIDKAEFMECYIRCMKFLAIFSLVEFAVFLFAYDFTLLAPQVTNNNGLQFSNWIFTISLNKTGYYAPPYRNWGIYREPGAYMCFLNLALMLELFGKEQVNIKNVLIFIITILSTLSTGGYVILAIIILTYLIEMNVLTKKGIKVLVGGIIILSVGVLIMQGMDIPLYKWVFAKLNSANGSTTDRIGSIFSGVALFLKSPIWGNGWLGMAENSGTIQSILSTKHNTNSPLIFFAVYGVLYGAIMLVGSRKFFSMGKRKNTEFLCFFAWMLALSNENLTLNITLYLVAFYGLLGDSKNQLFATRNEKLPCRYL